MYVSRLAWLCFILVCLAPIPGESQTSDPYFANQPPAGETVVTGNNVMISGVAGGTASISYQWQLNGTNLSGAANSSLYISPPIPGQYTYQLVATNPKGSSTSSRCVVNAVSQASDPYFNMQPKATSVVVVGGSVTPSAKAFATTTINYQWLLNGINIFGATSSTYSIVNATHSMAGSYQLVAINPKGSATSDTCVVSVANPPVITIPLQSQKVPYNSNAILSAMATGSYPPVTYTFTLNGNPVTQATTGSAFTISQATPDNAGTYGVTVRQGSPPGGMATSQARLDVYGTPGTATGWGDNGAGQVSSAMFYVTNVAAISAGASHLLELIDNRTVTGWGDNRYGQCTPPEGLNDAVGIAAGYNHSLAVKGDGTVVAWGLNNSGCAGPPKVNRNIKAVSAGSNVSLALRNDGTVEAWGDNTYGQLNVPAGLHSVLATACGNYHCLALKSDGTVVAWGSNGQGQLNVPAGLKGVVAISAGVAHSLALKSDGTVIAWGDNSYHQVTPIPSGLKNVLKISAGGYFNLVVKNDGSVVAWGDNRFGQTTVPAGLGTTIPQIAVAAGRAFSVALSVSGQVDYPVDVTQDLLLVYNSASPDSYNLLNYYLLNRPMVSGANVLPLFNCPVGVDTDWRVYNNCIKAQMRAWQATNPTKRPHYIILFLDVPDRIPNAPPESVSHALAFDCSPLTPVITHINMGTFLDCSNYVNKIKTMGNACSPGRLVISASRGSYRNDNYYVENPPYPIPTALTNVGVPSSQIFLPPSGQHITNGNHVAVYFSWGVNERLPSYYALAPNGVIRWLDNSSGWYVIFTDESFSGMTHKDQGGTQQGNYIDWFSIGAFGGTLYANTPVGAICNVNEPGAQDPSTFLANWASGKTFGSCAFSFSGPLLGLYPVPTSGWCYLCGRRPDRPMTMAVGDPFVRR